MFDLLNEIGQTLSHNKVRTSLTGLAVAWGIFMLIILLSMAQGVTNAFRDNMLGESSQQLSLWGGRTSKPSHGYKEGRRINMKIADMAVVEKEHPDFIDEVNSSISGGWSLMSAGGNFARDSYAGVFPSFLAQQGRKIRDGRFLNDKDMNERAKVIVLNPFTAEQLFPPDGRNAVGKRVNVGGLSFMVVGVYEARWGRSCYIPFTTAQALAQERDRVGQMNVMLKNLTSEADGEAAEKQVRETMAAIHEFDTDDESAIWIRNQFVDGLKGMFAMDILNTSVWVLGILTLLTGVVGISNIMFVSVRERTHEIGVRRAIGARPASVVVQIITEAIAITTLFGYIGIVLGSVAVEVINHFVSQTQSADMPEMIKDVHVNLAIAFEVTVLLILAGALAGLFPALKALKVKPVEALRDE